MKKLLLEKKNLIKRLTGYAASSGALMAFGLNVNGQVWSDSINVVIDELSGPYSLDMDGDGTTDFIFGVDEDYIPGINVANMENPGSNQFIGSSLVSAIGGLALIDGSSPSWNSNNFLGNLGYFLTSISSAYGPFPGNGDQYIGVRFFIGSDLHYGWIRVNVSNTCNSINIIDWAYELEPEAGILAGTFDNTPPEVTINSGVAYQTNQKTLTVDVTFNEPVIGLQLSDFSISNGSVANLLEVSPGTNYTIQATASVHGQVVLTLPAGAVTDSSLVENGLTTETWFYDNHPPTLTYDLGFTSPTNDPTTTITVTFSEEILNLGLADFIVTNGTASNLVMQTFNKVFTIDVNTPNPGLITVNLPAGSVSDYGSNQNAATAISWTYDNIKPIATITPDETGLTNTETMLVNISFDEQIQGLAITDFVVTNGVASDLSVITAGEEFSIEVTASGEGQVTIELPADAVTDMAGNGNALRSATWEYDVTSPVVTLDAGLTAPTVNEMIVVGITFDEEIQGLELNDLVITNGTAANLIEVDAGLEYTVEVTATGEGEVSVELPDAAVTDLAGNENGAATESWIYDISGPEATFTMGATNLEMVVVTVTFEEEVQGLELADFAVTNGSAANFVEVGAGFEYTIEVTATVEGEVTLSLQPSTITDLAGNNNPESMVSWLYDAEAPTVTLDAGLSGPTNASTIAVTIVFNENIQGLELSDLVITNGVAANLIEVTAGTEFSVEITASANGLVTVEVPAAAVTDLAGNENASASTSWTFDTSAPSVTLDAGVSGSTEEQMVTVTINMSEEVEGLTLADFNVINGAASNLVVVSAGEQYTVDITAATEGMVTINLPAGAVTDLAGNENATVSISYEYSVVSIPAKDGLTVKLYPNPASEYMFIELESEADITITDLSGQVAMILKNFTKDRIDLSGFSKGIYLMSIQTNMGTYVHKFVIE
jgi:hypothetical protein